MRDTDAHDELTPAEREAFEALPKERIPSAALEDRVVGSLHAEGLLSGAARPASRWSRGWLVAAVAAGLALFASGTATGQWLAGRAAADVVSAVLDSDPHARAASVQETGSAYVRAVARLSDLAEDGDAEALRPGREAAQVSLHAAALELARLSPEDATIQLVLAVLEERMTRQGQQPAGGARRTFWF